MDYGIIALILAGGLVGGACLLGLLSIHASLYYFNHKIGGSHE